MATNNRPLKAYVRFDGSGRVVAGSLILRKQKPKVGKWQEIPAYECCNPTTTTTTTSLGCDCRPGQLDPFEFGWNYFTCDGYNIVCPPGSQACREVIDPCFDINQPYSGIEIDTEAEWICECSTTTTTSTTTTSTTAYPAENCIEFVVDTTDGTEFTFSFNTTGPINFTIEWGDGTTHPDSGAGGFYEETHTYPEIGQQYTARICFDSPESVLELNFSLPS
jgi:hypothetical protein